MSGDAKKAAEPVPIKPFNGEVYVAQLLEKQGEGLNPEDQGLFQKLMKTKLEIAQTTQRRQQHAAGVKKADDDLMLLRGRVGTLCELLAEAEAQRQPAHSVEAVVESMGGKVLGLSGAGEGEAVESPE